MSEISALNSRARAVCEKAVEQAEELDLRVLRLTNGALIVDFGSDRTGTTAAGLELARICLADLAHISVESPADECGRPRVKVETDSPLAACIASQYAGWPFSTESYFSMCSGPARLKRGREEILTRFNLTSIEESAIGIFESNQLPTESDIEEFANQCGCPAANITICVARTSSLPGAIQVVARSVETAMHKLFELDFDLSLVKRGLGSAPIPPTAKNDYQAMGWTNDAILYGGDVHLWIEKASDLESLIAQLPSESSTEFGRPFIEIFEEYERDFYKVDRMLFSPARITVTCMASGKTLTAGAVRDDLLKTSFGTSTSNSSS